MIINLMISYAELLAYEIGKKMTWRMDQFYKNAAYAFAVKWAIKMEFLSSLSRGRQI